MATTSAALQPYEGPFGKNEAYHLLRRTTYGVTPSRVAEAVRLGFGGTLNKLLRPDATIAPPVNYENAEDPNVPHGKTWIRAPYVAGLKVNNYRATSLRNWLFGNFYESGFSLERRMLLFFINHFGARYMDDARPVYNYYETLRGGMYSKLPYLVKRVTVDPLMLMFLNGRDNRAKSPNENYARELLELFTIGKGPQIGSGNYTHYTEDDVRAFARALTGWKTRYIGSEDATQQPESYFSPAHHDTTTKTLSAAFGRASIPDAGDREYAAVVDLIFAQEHAGDYFCRKLYRWFVYHQIDETIERDIIQPLAQAFRESGYTVSVPILMLLRSEHFYEERFRGAIVKSPLEETLDLTVGLGLTLPEEVEGKYWLLQKLNYTVQEQDMRLNDPPSVAGYKPYHQAPYYNRMWINSTSLQYRTRAARSGIYTGYRRSEDTIYKADILKLVATFDNPADPNDLIAELVERTLPVSLSTEQLTALKNVLIPGLPDFEWTVEYNKHLDDPDDGDLRKAVSKRLNDLVFTVASSAEFRLY